jgi:hypothetical protein
MQPQRGFGKFYTDRSPSPTLLLHALLTAGICFARVIGSANISADVGH